MSDLIDRQAAIDDLRDYKTEPNISDDESEIKGYNDGIDLAISVLATSSSAEPEQKTGKWINCGCALKCSECGHLMSWDVRNFCPNCGARMEE